MCIRIEKAVPSDAAMLLKYLKQVGGETDYLTFGSEGVPFSVEAEAEFISNMENSSDDIMLLAKCGDKIVGCASLNRLPRRMKHRGDLAISVAKDYWNKGIGSRLLENIIVFARENDFHIIDLQVRSDNKSAIHLYEKFGFKSLGVRKKYYQDNNEDALIMWSENIFDKKYKDLYSELEKLVEQNWL